MACILAVVLIVTSRLWPVGDKAVGVLAVPVADLLVLLWLRIASGSLFRDVAVLVLALSVLCALYLAFRLRR